MAFEVSTGSTSIPFGANLRIGYRVNGSVSPFTYVTYYPSHNELPYTFNVPDAGVWEIEYTVVCPDCSGSLYSDPGTTIIAVSS